MTEHIQPLLQSMTISVKENLHPYDENHETFDCYLQRLDNHLQLKKIDDSTAERDKTYVQILISCLSPKIYQTLTKLTAPDLPNSKSYKELIKMLKEHLAPQASIIAEQHKFSLRTQHEGETIANYVAELRKMTTNCNFKCENCSKSTINTHLRTQFIRGIRDSEIRERLLQQKSTATFEEIVQIANSVEISKKEASQMQRELSWWHYKKQVK
ncbi:uncharacterized protein LOC116165755 [Photinus pyralis]|uniref:uncharacterized protein LOC116165755 n=1 Tax=Photinus pyralis TaxID=7054 RepID=UPI0012674AC7|nr:uncharacterized protein LOC116165755 [Photinus pyralis]